MDTVVSPRSVIVIGGQKHEARLSQNAKARSAFLE
jgi:hypothetical protein